MKLNKLLPIASITTLSSVMMPLVSCACNNKQAEIELTNEGLVMGAFPYIQSEVMNVKAGQEYKIKINMSQWETFAEIGTWGDWAFGFAENLNIEDEEEFPITDGVSVDDKSVLNKVYINGNQATNRFVPAGDIFDFTTLWIDEDISKDDIVTASLVFKDPHENGRIFMMSAS